MDTQLNSLLNKITALGGALSTSQAYRSKLIKQLRSWIPFESACFTTVDPRTLLSTGAITDEDIEAIHDRLFEYEYLHSDYNHFHELANSMEKVATLSGATNGALNKSPRYLNVLQPAGFHDEMRAALVADGMCWGFLTIFRQEGQSFFSEEERQLLSSLAPFMAAMLRDRSLPRSTVNGMDPVPEPGLLLLSETLEILSYNAAARQWMSLLQDVEGLDAASLPRPLRAVCFRALSENERGTAYSTSAHTRVRLKGGSFASIRASYLHGPDSLTKLAVTLEPANTTDMLPLISNALGLTERENEVISGILRGLSTKELAQSLFISPYTIQDHLKSIFVKTGVNSRRELIWQLHSKFSLSP
ncbi:helix-turn-helix transcriptional regulator [Paenibacillus lautus]|uniref:LuxR C-terminal-related transcriptional regulator n=1 Tax=Paenibacillus lautus TaxID=1401 RepID=UPI001B2334B1|nr:LuxR C-terminal-related transcriptional regulator [Paenibacillus lautus]GIO97417.1 helix-turn-helix transcriptional regulator [Paenibacillus lautus]